MSTRPYVICHMIPSVDGRIVTEDWRLPREAAGAYERTAQSYKADAWLVGRVSMEGYAGRGPGKAAGSCVLKGDFVANHSASTFAVALDPSGKLAFDGNEIDGEHVIVVLTAKAPAVHLAYLRRKGVSYIVGGSSKIDLPKTLHKLRSLFGIKKLLLEGGGRINGSLLKAGLIDELSVLVAPVADGRPGLATLFDSGAAGRSVTRLKLISHTALPGDLVWLRYKVR